MLAQDYVNLELVIVEDPSRRSAVELLRAFDDPRIVHLANPERTSHTRQRNQSLALARGELVATLDADDICDPRRISTQVRYFEQHPEVAVVGTQLAIIDTEGRVTGSRAYPVTHEEIVAAMPRFNPIAQPSVMFRKAAIVESGGYSYDRFPAEDYELWSRLAVQGIKFANLPEPLLRYRLHPGGMKATRLKGTLQGTLDVKNRYWRSKQGWRGHLPWRLSGCCCWFRQRSPTNFLHGRCCAAILCRGQPRQIERSTMSRNWVSDLIMDVGMHRGEDAEFYLKKGFRVVGVEANPELVADAGSASRTCAAGNWRSTTSRLRRTTGKSISSPASSRYGGALRRRPPKRIGSLRSSREKSRCPACRWPPSSKNTGRHIT